jgi:hypothetical protein
MRNCVTYNANSIPVVQSAGGCFIVKKKKLKLFGFFELYLRFPTLNKNEYISLMFKTNYILEVTPVKVTNAYGWMELQLHPFLTSALNKPF